MAELIYRACRSYLKGNKHVLFNSYILGWESDVFSLTKAGYSIEIEVKISRADYIKDFKKAVKHRLLTNYNRNNCLYKKSYTSGTDWGYGLGKYGRLDGFACWVEFCKPQEKIPNRFYYACPVDLIKVDEVPGYAGLIYVDQNGRLSVVKKAPLLHKLKNVKEEDLADKYYWRVQNAIAACNTRIWGEPTVEQLKGVINRIKNILY